MSITDCEACDGKGRSSHYGPVLVCDECKGTGEALTGEQRRMLVLVERLIRTRMNLGWHS